MLKMKIFAPVPVSYERATRKIGLAPPERCFSLKLAGVKRTLTIPRSEVYPLPIQEQNQRPPSPNSESAGVFGGLRQMRTIGWTSAMFALLQSLCTAVLTISGIRVAIGLSALAAASGIYAPAKGWHQDAIRIPMLILATAGALVNLAVLAWIRHLRNRPSAQWRRRELTTKQKRSERLQVALAIITLALVGLETWTHPMVHRKGPPPPCRIAGNCT